MLEHKNKINNGRANEASNIVTGITINKMNFE